MHRKIKSALISVYHKDGLEPILAKLTELGVALFSTGGTYDFIKNLGYSVSTVESITGYPSILGGRVKTLHPKVFGGILARRDDDHLQQLDKFDIPTFDLVIVDLYPFEETVKQSNDEDEIIEKIDIGGIALIRGAAKNFQDVLVVPSMDEYQSLLTLLDEKSGQTELADRKRFAAKAFMVSSHYDTSIFHYFNEAEYFQAYKKSYTKREPLRYGENPHQAANFYGDLNEMFEILGGKALSYNNLIDVDAAIKLMRDFEGEDPTFAILKHNNSCGLATRSSVEQAWDDALAGDPTSAFGGILITNSTIDLVTAQKIDGIFYEVLLAPSFDPDALAFLKKRSKRILLQLKTLKGQKTLSRTLLNGVIEHEADSKVEKPSDMSTVTENAPNAEQLEDLVFASKCVKHLKSNGIALVRNKQLIGMGCGQTSRVDALNQAIAKAKHFGFDLEGATMASDAFFPFPDCVEIAGQAGIKAIVQPGGSIKDQLSIDAANKANIVMVFTGTRHFNH